MSSAYVSADTLIELLGAPTAGRLLDALGGQASVYVPRAGRLDADHRLARAIGLEAARLMCAAYAGEYIELPIARDLRAANLRARIHQGLTDGRSHAQIAAELRITERYVRMVASRSPIPAAARVAVRQPDLFDAA